MLMNEVEQLMVMRLQVGKSRSTMTWAARVWESKCVGSGSCNASTLRVRGGIQMSPGPEVGDVGGKRETSYGTDKLRGGHQDRAGHREGDECRRALRDGHRGRLDL